MLRKNKGLASFLTAFVEKLGKTSPAGGSTRLFRKAWLSCPQVGHIYKILKNIAL
jgi:hypothetical protein